MSWHDIWWSKHTKSVWPEEIMRSLVLNWSKQPEHRTIFHGIKLEIVEINLLNKHMNHCLFLLFVFQYQKSLIYLFWMRLKSRLKNSKRSSRKMRFVDFSFFIPPLSLFFGFTFISWWSSSIPFPHLQVSLHFAWIKTNGDRSKARKFCKCLQQLSLTRWWWSCFEP